MAYDVTEERLKVKGSESITRDLQVTGDVYVGGELTVDNSKVLTEADKGVANGVATLDATGRVPYSQLPESAMEYKGTWDASTNTPTLTDGTGTNGDFYIVSVAGTVDFGAGRSITFYVNDRVIYDGATSQWARLPAGEVRSVNGQTGDVTLSIPAAQVNSDWNATSGVAQILNKPTIPTVVDTVADGNMNAVTSNAVYDYIDALDIASKLDKVTIMPANPTDNQSVLYLGETTENYVKGHLYQYIKSGDTSTWTSKTWSGLSNPSGYNVWTDGSHTYYSDGESQYVLDPETSTWTPKTWIGLTSFLESGVWTDGTNIYLSMGTKQYVLDIETSTWSPKTWNGLSSISGNNVWTDGTHIYYSLGTKQYVLDPATSTWSPKTWSGLTNISGMAIWSDGTHIYYSNNANQYVLDPSTSTWSPKTWSGLTKFAATRVWTDGTHFYYSSEASQYILDLATSTWTKKSWTGLTSFLGNNVWTDGTNTYYSDGESQYVLDNAQSWVDITPINFTTALPATPREGDTYLYSGSDEGSLVKGHLYQYEITDKKWESQSWSGLNSFNASAVWTDGTHTYYSDGNTHYVLDPSTNTWLSKTWSGLSHFYGNKIWSEGINVYYSDGTTQYALDPATSTWSVKTWSGLTNFYGSSIWTDGVHTYYSQDVYQYILDPSTSTWTSKIWSGLSNISGYNVWSDGSHTYYSDGESHYVLESSTWTPKTWSGFTAFYGEDVWTDGTDFYYSYGEFQYVLDLETSTWLENSWEGSFPSYGYGIWSDGTHIYYSDDSDQYVLDIIYSWVDITPTADAGAGNPVGTIIPMYKKSNPSGYLYCDGSTFDETKYPLLYAYLGSNILPDYREAAIVGAEQNTTDTIATHDVFTEGEFKDDQLQNHGHSITDPGHKHAVSQLAFTYNGQGIYSDLATSYKSTLNPINSSTDTTGITVNNPNSGRHDTVTRGKRKAVYFYIKATSGLSENAQDNVVAQLNEQRSYSTEEVDTGKKWIDGKKIYRKVIVDTTQDTSKVIATNVDSLISQGGYALYSNSYGSSTYSLPYYNNTSEKVICYLTNNSVYLSNNVGSDIIKVCFILEYTKTTG